MRKRELEYIVGTQEAKLEYLEKMIDLQEKEIQMLSERLNKQHEVLIAQGKLIELLDRK